MHTSWNSGIDLSRLLKLLISGNPFQASVTLLWGEPIRLGNDKNVRFCTRSNLLAKTAKISRIFGPWWEPQGSFVESEEIRRHGWLYFLISERLLQNGNDLYGGMSYVENMDYGASGLKYPWSSLALFFSSSYYHQYSHNHQYYYQIIQ